MGVPACVVCVGCLTNGCDVLTVHPPPPPLCLSLLAVAEPRTVDDMSHAELDEILSNATKNDVTTTGTTSSSTLPLAHFFFLSKAWSLPCCLGSLFPRLHRCPCVQFVRVIRRQQCQRGGAAVPTPCPRVSVFLIFFFLDGFLLGLVPEPCCVHFSRDSSQRDSPI